MDKIQSKRPIAWWGAGRPFIKAGNHGYIRKEQCNFGWDWGVKCVTCGIWRDINIVAYPAARLDGVLIRQQHSAKKATVTATVKAKKTNKQALTATAQLCYNGKTVAEVHKAFKGASTDIDLTVTNPKLWWPNTMGEQPLYDLIVVLRDADGNVLDVEEKALGLRTLELDRHADKWGESFQFKVNGVPFFAKGGNWIPIDTIQAHATTERYRALVKDCAEANMNMLRVWGGGIYEDEAFYQVCDELGICVCRFYVRVFDHPRL